MILALTIGVLTTGGVYLMMQRSMVRGVFGLTLISHAANFILLSAGVGAWRGEPLAGRSGLAEAADPLPQAFVLTAIVISMATTAVMLAMAALSKDDDTRSAEDTDRAQRDARSLDTRGRSAVRIKADSARAARRRSREEEH